ncbi:MAG: type IV pilus assembly protein PilY1, partial [Bacteroidia bacterium]
ADWGGNIKRLDISYIDDVAVLVDKNGLPAMDEATGLIKDNANTLWSSSADGPKVKTGGVGELLAASNLTTRANHVYSNTGASNALELLNPTNMTADAYGFDLLETLLNETGEAVDEAIAGFLADGILADQLLFAFWGLANQTELNDTINWGLGYDLEDENQNGSTSDNRPWILGDILHSKPFIMNYGARGSYTQENPDVRILAGTNAGFLHMFSNDDGQEDWAFFPKELASVMTKRKENGASLEHVYGIDASVVVHTEDLNYDGTLDYAVGDKAWMYFGLRRGGDYMYAMDISNPETPSMMWSISPDNDDFLEMGQTWSEPIIANIPGYYDNAGKSKPVLIFGAGYDPDKDDKDSLAVDNADDIGRGIYIVDAATGALVWSVTPADDGDTNMQETGLLHSVPAGVTVLDSNGDDLIDRIYFADTGGNLWRIDMPGNALPASSQSTWFITKMLTANGGTKATDRRFFVAPDVVRTDYLGQPVDAILLGSGDRTNPAELDNLSDITDPSVDNYFYMIRDQHVGPYFTALDDDECDIDPGHDFRCSLPMAPSALYDVSDNDLQDGDADEQVAAQTALNNSAGWRMSLVANGEKALARSITIDGKVYFTTFSPDAQILNICEPLPGTGRLYNVDLLAGLRVRDFDDDGTYERFISVGGIIPDTPSPHFDAEGEIRLLLPPGGTSPRTVGNPMETDSSIQQPYGSYWHRDDG